jgi:hypothetical protein
MRIDKGLKCHKCKRVVKETVHLPDEFTIDYYIIHGEVSETPTVECVDCRKVTSSPSEVE